MPNLPNLPHEGIRTETALCAGHSAPHEHGNKLNVSHWHFLATTSCYWRSLLPSQATRHWFVAAQWHASDAPTFQYITYLQAYLYCAELMPMVFQWSTFEFSMFRIFSHSTPVYFSWKCESGPKLRKSFIYHLCMPWCPTSKTDLTLECQTCQTCLMKEFERKSLCVLGILRPMNMETNWMFPTDISWPPHHAIGEACSHLKLPGTDSLPLSGMLPTPQLFNRLYTYLQASLYCAELMPMVFQWSTFEFSMFRIFSHSTPVYFSWKCESGPKLRKSFIYHLCMPWCPTSKTDLTLECQTCQTCLMKEFERKSLCVLGILRQMNMETNWMFPTDISWPPHHAIGEACSHLKLPGTDSLPLSGMLPTPQLFNRLYTYLQASLYCAELMPMVFQWSTFEFSMFRIFSHSTPVYFSWSARVARNCESHSFIICVCLGVQHLKLIWHWNAKPAKPASWRNSNGNSRVESQSWLQRAPI